MVNTEIPQETIQAIQQLGISNYLIVFLSSALIGITIAMVIYFLRNATKNQKELSEKLNKILETILAGYEKLGNRTEAQIERLACSIERLVSAIPSMTTQIIQANMENTAYVEQVQTEISHIKDITKTNGDNFNNHLETVYDRLNTIIRDVNRK